METEEIKLAKYINELSTAHAKFIKLGEEIKRANNGRPYVVDVLAYTVTNRAIQMTKAYVTLA